MKKRILLVSFLTIALCFSLIFGATYALFTSESKVNIAVTSGKVQMEANIENLKIYSLDVEQTDKFENGGTAVYENGVLTLDKMTPGDKVTFDIKIVNSSNINIKYRLKWNVSGKLSEALVAKANGADFANLPWTMWEANAAEKEIVLNVVVELPIETGNDYQDKVCDVVFLVEAIQANGLTSKYVTPATIADVLANAEEGDEIQLAAGYYDEIVVPKNGMKIYSTEGAEVGFLNINGKANVTIQGLTFDAANAKMAYNGNGAAVQPVNIAGASGKGNIIGARNVLIDDCTFTGTFVDGGGAIAFVDQKRPSGGAGDVTISNCKFDQLGGYFAIYFYYAGHNTLVIENNEVTGPYYNPVYLGRYQSSTPVVVKGNAFKTSVDLAAAVFLQDHSNIGVSMDAADNTFK